MEHLVINQESFSLSQLDFIIRLAVAVGIGGVIGLERQYSAMKENSQGFSGVRTFIILVLLGFAGGIFYHVFAPWVYGVILLGVVILQGTSYWFTATQGDRGLTTELSSVFAFILGTLVLNGLIEISLFITVILVVVLSSKFRIKTIVGKITAEELYDFIRFVVLALLIFPFLPDQTFGPYDVLNFKEIGWVVLLTSGLGLVGYILTKFLGANRGILLSGLVGGLVSSTAVTWVFAQKSKENSSLSSSCATAILAASSIMTIRVLIWTFIFNLALFEKLLIPILIVFIAGLGITVYIFTKRNKEPMEDQLIPLKKPLDLKSALVFGAIYSTILLLVSYANENLGERGTFISSAIAGISDIDAITISVSKLAGNQLIMQIAGISILIATISNTLVKMGIGIYAGSIELRKKLILGYGVVFGAGIIALFLIR
ncbi:MgtC/SapB family protein [Algoriphagus sp. AK58]|uniref:MgtC/SapB family protein n=1 Tax=Algoriphagus sp. AK58 TaxID=1406877 RepID=UPI0016502434|nr:MgtC/SapB family protein [Algoriphagus sp. AK58]MBC6369001.1 MgtC/SapB family protein [Algoriphagus sp. AK58]